MANFREFALTFRRFVGVEGSRGLLDGHFFLQGFPEFVAVVQPTQGQSKLVQDTHGEGARANGWIKYFEAGDGSDDDLAFLLGEQGLYVGEGVVVVQQAAEASPPVVGVAFLRRCLLSQRG